MDAWTWGEDSGGGSDGFGIMSKVEVRNLGSCLEVGRDGFLEKNVSKDLIQPRWRPLVEKVIEFYRSEAGENLLSVYVRGSVAKGSAVEFVSDLDSFCITKQKFRPSDEACGRFRKLVQEEFPFCNGVELTGSSLELLEVLIAPKKRNIWQELIKTQSVCVFGKDLADQIQAFELKDMVAHSYWIEREIETLPSKMRAAMAPNDSDDSVEQLCTWIMKRVVRVGFEIVMLRENKWTRDLYPCFESFSRYYPEKKSVMLKAVHLALNPSAKSEDTLELIDEFRPWLFEEIKTNVPGVSL